MEILLLFLGLFRSLCAFNLAQQHAQVYSAPEVHQHSYFGFTVAIVTGAKPRLVVGAPRANLTEYESLNVFSPGVVFTCDIDGLEGCKKILPGDPEDFLELHNMTDVFLGGSLDAEDQGSAVAACAPRWTNWDNMTLDCEEKSGCLLGLCYFLQNVSNSNEVRKLNPHVRIQDLQNSVNKTRYMLNRQAGTAVHLMQNGKEVVVGAAGIDTAIGGVLRFQFSNKEEITTVPKKNQDVTFSKDSYLGYSVSTGRFRKDKMLYVAGAPRAANYKGKVLVFDYIEGSYNVLHEFEGTQMGEYFGAALCVVDVNGDGLDDLLVGAPLRAITSAWDSGTVYIFLSSEDGLQQQEFSISGENKPGARFGMSISAVGDLNKDGYNDIVVGAPYEDGGRGAVYLYHGGKGGLKKDYSQRVAATKITSKLGGFGFSISRGMDVDGNRYNDIAVGAYESDNVVLIRSYPVVTVSARLFTDIDKITPLIRDFYFSACFSYSSREAVTTGLKQLEILATVKVDTTYKRASFSREKFSNEYKYSETIPAGGERVCRPVQVFVKPPGGQPYDTKPIDIVLRSTVSVLQGENFCLNCPVADPEQKIQTRHKLYVDLLCEDKNVCKPDLILTARFIDHVSLFVIGSKNSIRFQINLENIEEPAYHSQLNITVSLASPFRNIPSQCQQSASEILQLLCNVDKPLLQGDKYSLVLELDVSNLPMNLTSLQVNIIATSFGLEQNDDDNHVELTLPLKKDIDLLLVGKTDFPQIVYSEEEEESFIDHIYQIQNFGVTLAEYIQVELAVPTSVCLKGKYAELLSINSSQSFLDNRHFKCTTLDSNITDHCEEEIPKQKDILEMDCDSIFVRCTNIICQGGTLKSLEELQVTLEFKPLLKQLNKKLKKKKIVIESLAQARILSDDRLPAEARVRTTFLWEQQISMWIIVGSAVGGGLCLLLIIIFTLYKVGFFKRKKFPPAVETRLLQQGDMMDD